MFVNGWAQWLLIGNSKNRLLGTKKNKRMTMGYAIQVGQNILCSHLSMCHHFLIAFI